MKRIHLILISFFLGFYVGCKAQNHDYENLYGIWIPVERQAELEEFGETPYVFQDLEKLVDKDGNIRSGPSSRRKSLFISEEGLLYIKGGFEVVDRNKYTRTGKFFHMIINCSREQYAFQHEFLSEDTLHINVSMPQSDSLNKNIQAVFRGNRTVCFNINGEYHEFIRKAHTEFLDYYHLFEMENHLPKNALNYILYDLKESTKIPQDLLLKQNELAQLEGIAPTLHKKFSLSHTQIHFAQQDWEVNKTYYFDDCWVVLTKNTVSNTQRFFIFSDTEETFEYTILDPSFHVNHHTLTIEKG